MENLRPNIIPITTHNTVPRIYLDPETLIVMQIWAVQLWVQL